MGNKVPLTEISGAENLAKTLQTKIPLSRTEGIHDLFASKGVKVIMLSRNDIIQHPLAVFDQKKFRTHVQLREEKRSEVSKDLKGVSLINSKLRVIKVLGSGSYGTVLKVQDIKTKKNFALKCVFVDESLSKSNEEGENEVKKIRESIEREIELLKQVNHPNVVRYVDSFVIDKNPIVDTPGKHLCLQMEYVNGSDLDHMIQFSENNRYSLNSIVCIRWFIQILQTLHYIHSEKNIAHRDLKPDNVLLYYSNLEDATKMEPKLTDFGVGKILSKVSVSNEKDATISANEERNEKNSEFMGHLFYNPLEVLNPAFVPPLVEPNEEEEADQEFLDNVMSAESDAKEKVFDPRKSDIWNLGILFFQLYYRVSIRTLVEAIQSLMEEIVADEELAAIFLEQFGDPNEVESEAPELLEKKKGEEGEEKKGEVEKEKKKRKFKLADLMVFLLQHRIFKSQLVDPIVQFDPQKPIMDCIDLMLSQHPDQRPTCEELLKHPIIKTWMYLIGIGTEPPHISKKKKEVSSIVKEMIKEEEYDEGSLLLIISKLRLTDIDVDDEEEVRLLDNEKKIFLQCVELLKKYPPRSNLTLTDFISKTLTFISISRSDKNFDEKAILKSMFSIVSASISNLLEFKSIEELNNNLPDFSNPDEIISKKEKTKYIKVFSIIQQIRSMFLIDDLLKIAISSPSDELDFLVFIIIKVCNTLKVSYFSKNLEFVDYILSKYTSSSSKSMYRIILSEIFAWIGYDSSGDEKKQEKEVDVVKKIIKMLEVEALLDLFLVQKNQEKLISFQMPGEEEENLLSFFYKERILSGLDDEMKTKQILDFLSKFVLGQKGSEKKEPEKYKFFIFPPSKEEEEEEKNKIIGRKKKKWKFEVVGNKIIHRKEQIYEKEELEGEGEDMKKEEEKEFFVAPPCEKKKGDQYCEQFVTSTSIHWKKRKFSLKSLLETLQKESQSRSKKMKKLKKLKKKKPKTAPSRIVENKLVEGYYEVEVLNGGVCDSLSFGLLVKFFHGDEMLDSQIFSIERSRKKPKDSEEGEEKEEHEGEEEEDGDEGVYESKILFKKPVIKMKHILDLYKKKMEEKKEEEAAKKKKYLKVELSNTQLPSFGGSGEAGEFGASGTVFGMGITQSGQVFFTCDGQRIRNSTEGDDDYNLNLYNIFSDNSLFVPKKKDSMENKEEEEKFRENVFIEFHPWVKLSKKNDFSKCELNTSPKNDQKTFKFMFQEEKVDDSQPIMQQLETILKSDSSSPFNTFYRPPEPLAELRKNEDLWGKLETFYKGRKFSDDRNILFFLNSVMKGAGGENLVGEEPVDESELLSDDDDLDVLDVLNEDQSATLMGEPLPPLPPAVEKPKKSSRSLPSLPPQPAKRELPKKPALPTPPPKKKRVLPRPPQKRIVSKPVEEEKKKNEKVKEEPEVQVQKEEEITEDKGRKSLPKLPPPPGKRKLPQPPKRN